VLGGRRLCRGGGPVFCVWDESEHVHMSCTYSTVYTHVELKMVYCTSIYSTSNFTRTLIQLYIFVHT
jgi:hypothetical protein